MNYVDKLIALYGSKPESLPIHQKVHRFKTEEAAAKSIFNVLMHDRKEKARAKKLGLL